MDVVGAAANHERPALKIEAGAEANYRVHPDRVDELQSLEVQDDRRRIGVLDTTELLCELACGGDVELAGESDDVLCTITY